LRKTSWFFAKKRDRLIALLMAGVVLLSFSVFFLFNEQTVAALCDEDSFFESLGAVGIFAGSILLFVQFWKDRLGNDLFLLKTTRNYFLLLIALVFFVGAGEEISWGQRIFGVETPQLFQKENAQHEINLHNLRVLGAFDEHGVKKTGFSELSTMNGMFNVFWIFLCILVPLGTKVWRRLSDFFTRVNVPILPMWIGILLILTYVVSKLLEPGRSRQMQHAIVEVKECGFELLLGVAGLWLFLEWRDRRLGTKLDGSPSST
jgi:hypothetical protein